MRRLKAILEIQMLAFNKLVDNNHRKYLDFSNPSK